MMPSTTSTPDLTQQQQQQQQQQQIQQQQQLWMQYQQQQQWMAMQQYPAAAAAAMAMQQQQHQMLYQQQQQQQQQQQHYMSYHHPYQQQQQQLQQQQAQIQIQGGSSSSDENKTIWIGDLQNWMDETYLTNCFAHSGEVSLVKIIRNKQTGQSEKYGFVEFLSHAAAEKVLQSFNGTVMPNTDQTFRLNWATFSTGDRNVDVSSDFSIFVGDLAADVTDAVLHETFAPRYPSVKGAKVVVDLNTSRSKGYGFVRFGDENERSRAITEMNGMYCSTRPMRISIATPKKQSGQQQYSSQALVLTGGYAANGAMPQNVQSDGDLSNTTLFVGGLDSGVTDEDLRQTFSQCGEVLSVKIPAGKGCGFVQFANRNSAEDAIQRLTGVVIGSQKVRLSWGRSPGNKQNGAYYGRQGYGYAVPQNEDPNMYAGAYGASSNGYGNHQQSVS